jgi:AraC-like DNA-binding protein
MLVVRDRGLGLGDVFMRGRSRDGKWRGQRHQSAGRLVGSTVRVAGDTSIRPRSVVCVAMLPAAVVLWLPASSSSTTLILAFLAGVSALLLLLVVFLSQRQSRRQIAALLARLDSVEARLVTDDYHPLDGEADVLANAEDPAQAAIKRTPTGDVLAGMTTHVRNLVDGNAGAQNLADQAICCIYRHLADNLTAAELATKLHVSLRTLERGLAMVLECTPSQLILAVRMREARRLLVSGDHRVADVAERLGFANPFHFSRRFKSFYHVPPSELRR